MSSTVNADSVPADSVHRLTEDFFQDPHAEYRRLNELGPVHRVEFPSGVRAWLVTGYEEAKQALTDPTVSKELYGPAGELAQANGNAVLRLDPPVNDHMLYSDPPRHARLRKTAMKALSSRVVHDFTPRIERIAQELLDGIEGKETVDLLAEYAYPFSCTVICELIGIDAADRGEFEKSLTTQVSTADAAERHAAAAAFGNYVNRLIDARERTGGNDLMSELLAPADDGDRLDRRELVAMVNVILLGSQETTSGLIGNAVLMLQDRPELRAQLLREPGLTPAFLEEVLRYESSGNISSYRFTTAPVRIGGRTIEGGQILLVAVASANRDPRQFDRPHELDPHRADNRHLAFGHGIHRCPGAALARVDTRIGLSALLNRFPDLSLAVPAGELRWQPSLIARSLVSLPVRLGTA
ncbi:cytochrome P450 family protein [Streptomyces sp. 1331.2]|uniref:cytochrome P450 family protein n=1 Tax=Streptomyces sp. 1331.2 TaxID=1938835 RepID=UPI000BDA7589|nr:cytochrome P450 [Streptomyces sp. 1331.2]SOB85220.1 Cytochrome P450 [Streptomyces sp. 1331.2]